MERSIAFEHAQEGSAPEHQMEHAQPVPIPLRVGRKQIGLDARRFADHRQVDLEELL